MKKNVKKESFMGSRFLQRKSTHTIFRKCEEKEKRDCYKNGASLPKRKRSSMLYNSGRAH